MTFGLRSPASFARPSGGQLRRSSPRRRVVRRGLLAFGMPEASYECAIKNLSDSGARIRLVSQTVPPGVVWLIDINDGVAYLADLAWRALPEIGLKFIDRHDLRLPKPGTVMRLRALWLDANVTQR